MRLSLPSSLAALLVLVGPAIAQDLKQAVASTARAPEAARMAAEIKRSGPYRDPGAQESSNWLGKAIERLLDSLQRQTDDEAEMPAFGLPPFVRTVAWGLLAAAGVAFGWFAWRHFAWRRSQSRQAQAILSDDEPDRTESEWLGVASDLEAKGDLRGAARAVYLAILVRLDQLDIARFDRSQTNWEHLARFERSLRRPGQTDFRRATRTFDAVWYGHRDGSSQDLAELRETYRSIGEEAAS